MTGATALHSRFACARVSVFSSVKDQGEPTEDVELSVLLDNLREPDPLVSDFRNLGLKPYDGKPAWVAEKLQGFTPAGTFTRRKNVGWQGKSGIVGMDLDAIKARHAETGELLRGKQAKDKAIPKVAIDPPSAEDATRAANALRSCPYVVFAVRSLSGHGFCVGFAHLAGDARLYKQAQDRIHAWGEGWLRELGLFDLYEWDVGNDGAAQFRYWSHEPDPVFGEAVEFDPPAAPPKAKPVAAKKPAPPEPEPTAEADAFEKAVSEANAGIDVTFKALADRYGAKTEGEKRQNGPCPICGGEDRFYRTMLDNGRLLIECNQGCSFPALLDKLREDGVMPGAATDFALTAPPEGSTKLPRGTSHVKGVDTVAVAAHYDLSPVNDYYKGSCITGTCTGNAFMKAVGDGAWFKCSETNHKKSTLLGILKNARLWSPYDAGFRRAYVDIEREGGYIEKTTGLPLSKEALTRRMRRAGLDGEEVAEVFDDPQFDVAYTATLIAGHEGAFYGDRITYWSTWTPKVHPEVSDADVARIKDLFETRFLRGFFLNKDECDRFMSYMAMHVQYPGLKGTWCPYLCTTETGTGKGTIGVVLKLVLGRNVATVTPNTVKHDWTDWLVRGQIVILEELTLDKRDGEHALNTLKPAITEELITVEKRNVGAIDVINRTNFLIFSNSLDALAVTSTDRRFWYPDLRNEKMNVRDPGLTVELYRALKEDAEVTGAALRRWLVEWKIPAEHLRDIMRNAPMSASKRKLLAQQDQHLEDIEAVMDRAWPEANRRFIALDVLKQKLPPSWTKGLVRRLQEDLERMGYHSIGKAMLRDRNRKQTVYVRTADFKDMDQEAIWTAVRRGAKTMPDPTFDGLDGPNPPFVDR